MKVNFIKNIFTIISLLSGILIFSSCSSSSNKINVKAQIRYAKLANKVKDNCKWISFDVRFETVINGKPENNSPYHLSYCYDKENPAFYLIYADCSQIRKVKKDCMFIVNNENRELASFMNSRKNDTYFMFKNDTEIRIEYMPFYGLALPGSLQPRLTPLLQDAIDTIVNDNEYVMFVSRTPLSHIQDVKTKKFDVPLQYECVTWLNAKTNQVDSVITRNITDNIFKIKEKYYIENVSFDDKSSYFDSIFDFNNPHYAEYSRHTEDFLPYSMTGTNNNSITNELLDYPLVNLNNDTTSIRKRDGWVLLNFWSFGCQPCLKNLQNYLHEKDSLGYIVLENQGVEILAINYRSDNMDLIMETAGKTKTTDIMYSAKGMNTLINIPYLGYYYLISPDKKIVYESATLGDYSELLKAKNDYPQR